jgi:UDP-N-acetylmuramoylalanine--D-glutamate ligase
MKNIQDKKISVIGAVRSGIGAAKLAKKLGAVPFVSDSGSRQKLQDAIKLFGEEGIKYECGEHTEAIYDCDFIITSPGVPSESPVLQKALDKKIKIYSELEFSSWFCKGNVISITGTNGKTTTTSLCGHVFNSCGLKTYLAGNIGYAFSEIALDVKENECVALETSSFQLDNIEEFKPRISALLNITPDHLDRYNNDIQNYINSKLRVFEKQDENDYLILNADDKLTPEIISNKKVNVFHFSLIKEVENGAYLKDDLIRFATKGKTEFVCNVDKISLKGEHNYANAMAVISMAKLFNLDNDKIIEALGNFPGVEHRLEFVRDINGVKYYNDSKATNVDSVWYALKSFEQPIFLILGGKDKGNDYNQIKELVDSKVKKIYAIGSSSEKVFNFFHKSVKVELKGTIDDCIIAANQEAREGDVVLLSPACASFDMFDNFEHRGKVFKEAVNKL